MSSSTQPTEPPFRVQHAIGDVFQVVEKYAGVVSSHDGRESAERECERRNRTAQDSRKVIR